MSELCKNHNIAVCYALLLGDVPWRILLGLRLNCWSCIHLSQGVCGTFSPVDLWMLK